MTTWDAAAALAPDGAGRWKAEIPPDWLQGRTTFGGLVAGIALAAAQQVAGPDRPIRSIDVAFAGALPAGPCQVTAQVLSAGRRLTQVVVEVRTLDGDLTSRTSIVAGTGRASQILVPGGPRARESMGDPDTAGVEFPYIEGVTPTFTQNMALRWCGAHFPFTGSGPEGAVVRAWIRHRTPATGLPAVVALMDAAPPAVLTMFTGPAPASTVRWSAQVLEPELLTGARDASSTWFWLECDTIHARDGFAVEAARLYLEDQLVACSEQTVAVYDRVG